MACTYYQFKDGDYYCFKKNDTVKENDYYRYCRNYSYDECPIYKYTESSGCFITTVACQILGKQDNDPILNNFRNFRDNVLQKDEKYYDTLKEYDTIGPVLADCIINDKDKEKLALGIYETLINKNELIDKKEYDLAVVVYTAMTLSLECYYGLEKVCDQIRNNDYEEIEPSLSGHGIRRVKTIKA